MYSIQAKGMVTHPTQTSVVMTLLTHVLGFRRAENIKRTMELTQWFYGQIFGFNVPGVEGVPIDNFPQGATSH